MFFLIRSQRKTNSKDKKIFIFFVLYLLAIILLVFRPLYQFLQTPHHSLIDEDYVKPKKNSNVCYALFGDNEQIPATNAIWYNNLKRIAKASSMIDNDISEVFAFKLLQIVTSHRLQLGVQKLPRNMDQAKKILDIAYTRYMFAKEQQSISGQDDKIKDTRFQHEIGNDTSVSEDPNAPPKLRIFVMGGSVTAGVRCRVLLDDPNHLLPNNRLFTKDFSTNINCAWPYRLESLVNSLIGEEIIEVTNGSVRASTTAAGTSLLKSGIIKKNPHIIINAYSTNDKAGNFEDLEEFARYVLKDGQCEKPLLLHFHDTILQRTGFLRQNIYGLSEKIQTLATYYGFGAASYVSVLGDVILGDPNEYWFKPVGWNYRPSYRNPARENEVHPQVGMHIVSAWTVGYYLLNLVTSQCGIEQEKAITHNLLAQQSSISSDQKLVPPGAPQFPPLSLNILPPPLTEDLTVRQYPLNLIKNEAKPARNTLGKQECTDIVPSCSFTWISGVKTEIDIEKLWAPIIANNNGWSFQVEHNKVGLVPVCINSTIELAVPNMIDSSIIVTIMAMKSYGHKWANSIIHVDVFVEENNTLSLKSSIDVLGFHEEQVSMSYVNTISVSINATKTRPKSLYLKITLIEGTTAKIMGLTICKE